MANPEIDKLGFMHFLRLLTPHKIATMSKTSTGVKKFFLTDVIKGNEILVDPLEAEAQEEEDAKLLNFPIQEKKNERPAKEKVQNSAIKAPISENASDSDNEDVEVNLDDLELSREEAALSKLGIASKAEDEERARRTTEAENKKKVSTSVFILLEKEKSRRSQDKLKSKEILVTYEGALAVNIEAERVEDESQRDLKQSSNSGILVNKKQF
jgi:hypothetical protein